MDGTNADQVQYVDHDRFPLYRYTRYVKRLTFYGTKLEIDHLKLAFLYRANRGKPLFPSLQSLTLGVWPIAVTEASLLMSSGLVKFFLAVSSTPKVQRAYGKLSSIQHQQLCIQMLCRRCPSLHSFSIMCHLEMRCIGPVLSLKHLTTVEFTSLNRIPIGGLPPSLFGHLSKMANLSDFNYDFKGLTPSSFGTVALGPFNSLRSLTLRTDVSLLNLLFNSWHPHALVSIDISVYTHPEMEGLHIGKAIEKLVSVVGKTLKSFSFGHTYTYYKLGFPFVLETLRPIACAQHLEKFKVSWHAPFTVTDQDVIFFAKAWPNLQEFTIDSGYYDPRTLLTIHALVELATRCPNLRYIYLHIDFLRDDLPPFDTLPRTELKLEKAILCRRIMDNWNVDSIKRLVAVMCRLCPLTDPWNYVSFKADSSIASQVIPHMKR